MNNLHIEVHGTGTHNRGAELMAIAIADRLRSRYPKVKIVVPPEFGKQEDIERYGFVCTWEAAGRYGWIRTGLNMLRWLPRRDVVNPSNTDIVLDASGFAFADQWGEVPAKNLYRKMQRFYRKQQPLILLPQALGAFEKTSVSLWCKRLFSRASLVCARDAQSFQYVQELASPPKLQRYPDFTIGVAPILSEGVELPKRFVAIVPNMRMLDKSDEGERYLKFLAHAIDRIKERGGNPLFVIHDAKEDRNVVELMGAKYTALPILTHPDPRVLKGILGYSDFVVGSRYHALVSSLSQGVPCIGAGWSHKYPELFADFDCPELLISDLGNFGALDATIDKLTNGDQFACISNIINNAAAVMKDRVDSMWEAVFTEIDTQSQKDRH